MAVKKTEVKDLEAKVAKAPAKKPAAKAEVKAEAAKVEAPKAEVKKAAAKPAAKKAPAKKEAAKVEAPKAEVKKAAAKPAAKKAPAKKATATKAKQELYIQYNNGNVAMSDIIAKALEVSGKKTVKELNVYYQPENAKVYYTADGQAGDFDL